MSGGYVSCAGPICSGGGAGNTRSVGQTAYRAIPECAGEIEVRPAITGFGNGAGRYCGVAAARAVLIWGRGHRATDRCYVARVATCSLDGTVESAGLR